MKYSIDELISDLNNRIEWNKISEKCIAAGLTAKNIPEEKRQEFKKAYDKYFNVKYQIDEEPPIHVEVPRKKK